MKNIVFFLFLTCSFIASSQLKTGLNGYYGASIFNNGFVAERPSDSYVTKYDQTFGAGLYLKYSVNDWFSIRTSPFVEQLRTFDGYYVTADETFESTAGPLPLDENGELDWFASEYWIRSNYLSIPIGLEFEFSKFQIELGAQYSYMLKIGSASRAMSYVLEYDTTNAFKWSDGFIVYDRFNISVYSLIRYNLVENLFLEARFCQGVNNIFLDYFTDNYTRTRQFQCGITYEIWPRKKKDKPIDEIPVEDLNI